MQKFFIAQRSLRRDKLKIAAIILFLLMYAGIFIFPRFKHWVALGTALIFIVFGILPLRQIPGAIDWNVLMMLTGTMVLVDYFIQSQMPAVIADKLLKKAPNLMWLTIFMSLFAGVISAFIDNVSTVLMVAPVGLAICRKLKISPVNMIICIAVSSNLQGAATLVGDTTSIMLGAYANMDFMDFFWMKGRPGIFFAVELGALCTVPIMMWMFRKDKDKVETKGTAVCRDHLPGYMMLLMIGLLIAASFIPGKPAVTNGVICLLCAALNAALEYYAKGNKAGLKHAAKELDVQTLQMLFALFLVIGGISHMGIIDDLAALIAGMGSKGIFLLYTVVVWASVLISAFIDNIPYVATMLPVLQGVIASCGAPAELLYFGLLTGATLGGNLTPIGASANIAGVGMLIRRGYKVGFKEFCRIGVPFTLAAVTAGYIYIWVVYSTL
jgi:Na+/H+ antiporter NhaD/arsenite permease-like protein